MKSHYDKNITKMDYQKPRLNVVNFILEDIITESYACSCDEFHSPENTGGDSTNGTGDQELQDPNVPNV